jgi:hypothetical protein
MRDRTVRDDCSGFLPISTCSSASLLIGDLRLFLPRVRVRGEDADADVVVELEVDESLLARTDVKSNDGPAGDDERIPIPIGSISSGPSPVYVEAATFIEEELLDSFAGDILPPFPELRVPATGPNTSGTEFCRTGLGADG